MIPATPGLPSGDSPSGSGAPVPSLPLPRAALPPEFACRALPVDASMRAACRCPCAPPPPPPALPRAASPMCGPPWRARHASARRAPSALQAGISTAFRTTRLACCTVRSAGLRLICTMRRHQGQYLFFALRVRRPLAGSPRAFVPEKMSGVDGAASPALCRPAAIGLCASCIVSGQARRCCVLACRDRPPPCSL